MPIIHLDTNRQYGHATIVLYNLLSIATRHDKPHLKKEQIVNTIDKAATVNQLLVMTGYVLILILKVSLKLPSTDL
ncbi:hypothetical protein JCM19239_1479 [Vibrio variabilis]|uniref:Uncharacterized protein n=1 Tax=Vibrio variabilis TaxID=990271 RepID=A0ABQ0JG92_9VIBR|nr:hypothetical protein JCM19239_1479 [Vibrio variabilis]